MHGTFISPSHTPNSFNNEKMPSVNWWPKSLVMRMPTPISTTNVGTPASFKLWASVDSWTVAAELIQIKSVFSFLHMEEVFRPFLHWPLPVEFPWGKYCWHGYQCKEKHLSDPPWSYTLRIPAGSFPQNPEIHGSYQDQIPEHLWWSNLLPEDLTQDKFLRFPLNIPNVLQSVCLIHNRQTAPPVHHRGCRLQYILFFTACYHHWF